MREHAMTQTVQDSIKSTVTDHDIVLFMKGTPVFPQCGFSSVVARVLDHLQVDFESVNVLEHDDVRQGIKEFSNWPTIPQLYVKGEFVGGCDIIKEMFESGELQTYLRDKGVMAEA
jgi:monothiol glutaredoxin